MSIPNRNGDCLGIEHLTQDRTTGSPGSARSTIHSRGMELDCATAQCSWPPVRHHVTLVLLNNPVISTARIERARLRNTQPVFTAAGGWNRRHTRMGNM